MALRSFFEAVNIMKIQDHPRKFVMYEQWSKKFSEVQKQHQLLWNSLILNADGKLCFLKNKFNRIRHRLLHHNKICSVNVKDEHLYKNPTASHDLQKRMNMHL